MASPFKISKIMVILIFLAALGALVPAASAVFDSYQNEAPPCCPIFEDYPGYYYPVDPYYQFPLYCSCPFLDDALERFEEWDIPSSYWEYVINQESQCTTCTGTGSTVMSYSYSNSPLIIPEKDSIMTAYDKISVSTAIKSKDQARAAYG